MINVLIVKLKKLNSKFAINVLKQWKWKNGLSQEIIKQENGKIKMEDENTNTELFSATMVLTAYVDENGNVKYVKSSWDDLFKKEEDNA